MPGAEQCPRAPAWFCFCLGVGPGCCLGISRIRKEDCAALEVPMGPKRWDWRDLKTNKQKNAYPSQKKKRLILKCHLPALGITGGS